MGLGFLDECYMYCTPIISYALCMLYQCFFNILGACYGNLKWYRGIPQNLMISDRKLVLHI